MSRNFLLRSTTVVVLVLVISVRSYAQHSHTHSDLKDITDLSKDFVKELKNFFVQYHKLDETEYRCLGEKGKRAARSLLESQMIGKAA